MTTFTELFRLIGGIDSIWAVLFIFLMYHTFKDNKDSIRDYKKDADEENEYLRNELRSERERSDVREQRSIERGEKLVEEMRGISRTLEKIDANQERLAEGQKRTTKDLERLQADVDKMKDAFGKRGDRSG